MNITARFNQSPVEKKRYLIDWNLQLASGETVSSAVINITSPTDVPNAGGCEVTGFALAPAGPGGVPAANTTAAFFVDFTNPTVADQNIYNVQIIATTSVGQKLEDVLVYNAIEKLD